MEVCECFGVRAKCIFPVSFFLHPFATFDAAFDVFDK